MKPGRKADHRERAMNEEEKFPATDERKNKGLWGVVILLVCATVVSLGYAIYQRTVTGLLVAANSNAESKLAQTGREVKMLSQKLSTLEASQAAAVHPIAMPSRRVPEPEHARRRPAADRYNKLESELAEHQKEIDSTQQALNSARSEFTDNLNSARTDLGGSIAKTHDQLVALEKKGQRNYYEFDIVKSKRFSREGPLGIKLRKANTKHQYADLELIVDDREVTKKHVNVYEPVLFYPEDSRRPIRIVIIGISKNLIHGYVSSPRYSASELAAANSAPIGAPAAGTQAGATGAGVVNSTEAPAAALPPPATPVELRHRPATQN